MHIHRLCGGEGCVCQSVCQSGWGKITEERTAQEVLKFKILLALGSLAREGLCVCGPEWIPFSSNSSEWVPWTRFRSQNLEHWHGRKCWSSVSSCFLILASRWSIGDSPSPNPPQEPAFALCVFRFYFYFGTLSERVSERFPFGLPLCSCKVLFLSWCCKLHFH